MEENERWVVEGVFGEEMDVESLLEGDGSEEEYDPGSEEEEADDLFARDPLGDPLPIWRAARPPSTPLAFSADPGLKAPAPGPDPIHFFNLVAPDRLLDSIVEGTNRNAHEIFRASTHPHSRINSWKDLARPELEVFLGLFFHMANVRLGKIHNYWKKSRLYNCQTFSLKMSRDRFLLIMRALGFGEGPSGGDEAQTDPLSQVQGLVDSLHSTMSEAYHPGRDLRLCKPFVLWKGAGSNGDSPKTGSHNVAKLYQLMEQNGTILKLFLYVGLPGGEKRRRLEAVKNLVLDYRNKGHSVYMDRFYSSVDLCRDLYSERIYSTGVLSPGARFMPSEVANARVGKGESVKRYTDEGVCVVRWVGRKEVVVVSSEHSGETVELAVGGKPTRRPEAVASYDKFMAKVEFSEALLSNFANVRRSPFWNVKVIAYLLHVVLNNGYRLHQKYGEPKMTFTEFTEKIVDSLLFKDETEGEICTRTGSAIHLPTRHKRGSRIQRRCRVCYRNKVRKSVNTYCPDCFDSPALCLSPCFRIYHYGAD